jgi:ABC-2 type transport system ATP-binding protein
MGSAMGLDRTARADAWSTAPPEPGRPQVRPAPAGTWAGAGSASAAQHTDRCGELAIVVHATPPPLLTLTGVSRKYGERLALSPVDLAVAAGRCVAVMGENGSGKSTLLRIAAGRDAPTTGQVVYAGRGLTEDDLVVRTEVAVVGDIVSAYPDLTVREHLQLVAVAHGAGRGSDDLIDRALTECRLAGHADALPGSLSSGQQQALHLAAALVRPRRLMVLDEPEQRLSAEKRAGVALLMATHHTELATAVADHVLVLSDGVIIGQGKPETALAAIR